MSGFSTLDNSNHQGATNTWLTPLWLIKKLGEFDLDPCGYPGHETAKKLICEDDDDGLMSLWHGRVWLNPPYGRFTGVWLDKLAQHGNGIALVFSRTDTTWFQRHAKKADWIFFLSGRIKFEKPGMGANTNAGHGSCLIGYGNEFNYDIEGVLMKPISKKSVDVT